MPVYEFRCLLCEQRFERYVPRFTEAVACPACCGTQVEKQLSTFAMAGAPARGDGGCCGGGGCGCH